jgi:hypothetical protein
MHQPALTLVLIFSWLSAVAYAEQSAPFSDRLLRDEALWGDGQAEYTVFAAQESRYGLLRETEIRHILVRENFTAAEQVKADDWKSAGSYAVLKLNQIITVPTGSYRYDQGHSSFWRADTGSLIKFALTSNDSCGLTYKQGNYDGTRWRYRAFTYWQGMSEVELQAKPPAGALYYDELPFKLRLLNWGQVNRFKAPLLGSIIGSKADQLLWPSAEFVVAKLGDEWQVSVTHAKGEDRFFFAVASPHVLKRWERWDGSSLLLRQLIRMPYWQLNRPGDERYLKPGATYP